MSDPEREGTTSSASKGLSSKLVLAIAGANLVATAGLAALVARGHPAAPAPPTEAATAPAEVTPAAAKTEAGEKAKQPAAAPAEGKESGAAKGAVTDAPPTATTARLEDIVIHLRNPEVDRYARLTIDVEMARADELKQLQDNVPKVRDAIIVTLSAYTFEELRGPEGLMRLKSVLRDAIDKVVPGDVTNVLVSTFLVQ